MLAVRFLEPLRSSEGRSRIVNAAAIHPFGTVVETDFAIWNRCTMVN
jgi:hypothetical protein